MNNPLNGKSGAPPSTGGPRWSLYHFGCNQHAHDRVAALMMALAQATA